MPTMSVPSRKNVLFLPALLALFFLAGCGTSNPICGSSRPKPLIGSLSPSTMDFAQVQAGTVLTVTGSQFVSSSVVVINGQTLSTTFVSSQELQVPITTGLISAPGQLSVFVQTPGGNSGDIGCASGGNSSVLVLTIT
jgi:trimeric autotransporter adhesin